MFQYKDCVYLDLEKTGSTFIRDMLPKIVEGHPENIKQHDPLPDDFAKPRIMTIRHPLN